jgi:hypothetical protein
VNDLPLAFLAWYYHRVKLSEVWLVCDPTPKSGLKDFVWKQSVAGLEQQIRGGRSGWWRDEHVAIHTDMAGAVKDARERSAKVHHPDDTRMMFAAATVRHEFAMATVRHVLGG